MPDTSPRPEQSTYTIYQCPNCKRLFDSPSVCLEDGSEAVLVSTGRVRYTPTTSDHTFRAVEVYRRLRRQGRGLRDRIKGADNR